MAKRKRSMSFGRGTRTVSRAQVNRAGKRRRVVRRRKGFALNVHKFSRYNVANTFEYNADGQAVDFDFKFTDIINYSEFSSLFDQFKITKVVLKFQLINNPDAVQYVNDGVNSGSAYKSTNFSNWYPKLWYIRDSDGGSSETISTIKERQGAKYFIMRPNVAHSMTVSPSVAIQTYKTALTSGYGPKKMFLDMAGGTSVPHYGVKTVLDTLGIDPNDTYPFKIRYEAQFYFTCKDVR